MPDLVGDPRLANVNQPSGPNPLHDDDPSNDDQYEAWKANADLWREWAARQDEAIAKLVQQGAAAGETAEQTLAKAGFKNAKEQGMHAYTMYGTGGYYSQMGAAADPGWRYDWGTGLKYNMGTDDLSARTRGVPINANEYAEYQKAQNYNKAGINSYGAQSNAEAFKRAVSYGHFTRDPKTGLYYNVGKGDPNNPATWQWSDQYGRAVNYKGQPTGQSYTGQPMSSLNDGSYYGQQGGPGASAYGGAGGGYSPGSEASYFAGANLQDAIAEGMRNDILSQQIQLQKNLEGYAKGSPIYDYLTNEVYGPILGVQFQGNTPGVNQYASSLQRGSGSSYTGNYQAGQAPVSQWRPAGDTSERIYNPDGTYYGSGGIYNPDGSFNYEKTIEGLTPEQIAAMPNGAVGPGLLPELDLNIPENFWETVSQEEWNSLPADYRQSLISQGLGPSWARGQGQQGASSLMSPERAQGAQLGASSLRAQDSGDIGVMGFPSEGYPTDYGDGEVHIMGFPSGESEMRRGSTNPNIMTLGGLQGSGGSGNIFDDMIERAREAARRIDGTPSTPGGGQQAVPRGTTPGGGTTTEYPPGQSPAEQRRGGQASTGGGIPSGEQAIPRGGAPYTQMPGQNVSALGQALPKGSYTSTGTSAIDPNLNQSYARFLAPTLNQVMKSGDQQQEQLRRALPRGGAQDRAVSDAINQRYGAVQNSWQSLVPTALQGISDIGKEMYFQQPANNSGAMGTAGSLAQANQQYNLGLKQLASNEKIAKEGQSSSFWGNLGGAALGALGSIISPIKLSDERAKKNVSSYSEDLDDVSKMKPKRFEYNGKMGSKEGQPGVSVMAQDAKKLDPKMTTTMPGGAMGVKPMEILMKTVNSVKRLEQIVAELQQRRVG